MSLNRQNGGFLLGFAALAAALLVALSPRPAEHGSAGKSEKRPEDQKASLLNSGPVPEGPTKPIWDFLGQTPPKAETPGRRFAVTASGKGMSISEEAARQEPVGSFCDWPSCCDLQDFCFRFLIATVPDPTDSGLAYAFDQVLEAVQRALEADYYVIDHAWLPWRRAAAGKQDAPRLQERYPGLVLFRDDRLPTKRLLALLLVGETPTAGIHKLALQKAVRVIHTCTGHKEEGNRIRVLGPYFSGSAVSLGLALREARQTIKAMPPADQPQEPWIKVVCGSASGFSHRDFVRIYDDEEDVSVLAASMVGLLGSPSGRRPGGIASAFALGTARAGGRKEDGEAEPAFAATILPNDLLLRWVRRYLGDPTDPKHGKSPAPIVVLHEANTSFGQYAVGKSTGPSDLRGPELLLVPFPLHISQLRASYTKEQQARAESQGLPHSGRNLPFPSEDQGEGEEAREAVPVRDPLMAATIDDLILDNIVTTMAQKRANYACLVSTDVRDTIFLAREIRDRHPDVQLVSLGADLLLTHEDYNYALRGVVVASTYPLYPSVQGWSGRGQDRRYSPRIVFAHEAYQGCYNAALVQLAAGEQEHEKEVLADLMMDYGWEGPRKGVTMPPLWISVVGGDGQLVPVTYIAPKTYDPKTYDPCDGSLAYVYPRKREAAPSEKVHYGRLTPPHAWFLLFSVFLFVNVAIFWLAFRYLRKSDWDIRVADRSARYKQRIDFAVGCLALVLLYGMIAELACTPLRVVSWGENWLVALAVGLVWLASLLMVGFSCIMLLCAHLLKFTGGDSRSRAGAYADVIKGSQPLLPWPRWLSWPSRAGLWIVVSDVVMLAVVLFAGVCFFWRVCLRFSGDLPPQRVIDFDRAVHLSNGVSPLLPRVFFCAALFGWSFFLVKKLHLANHYSIECPFPCNGSASFSGLRGLDRDIHTELMPPSTIQRHFGWCVSMFALVLLGLASLVHDTTWPMDGVRFGYWTSIGFGAGSFLLLFTLLQFHFAWRSLRKLLRFVALLPMQNAFERLSDKAVAIFGHYLYSLRPRHSHLGISVQQFHRVRRLFPAFRAELQRVTAEEFRLGQLDEATLNAAWQEVQLAFPEEELGPPVAQQFDQELNPVAEEDLEPPANSPVPEWGGVTGADIEQLTRHCLRVLYPFWSVRTMEEAFGRAPRADESAAPAAHAPSFLSLLEGDPIREWAVAAEDFVAVEIVRYLSQFIVQLRNLLTCLTLGSLLLVLAATVYPFSAQYKLLLFLTILAGAIACFILTFLIQLNRDELVSRITRSTPNRFTPDWSFLQSTAAYVLPILAGLMVRFPLVTSTLRSLLDPLFHIIK